jgi:pimeloyl-ACP methyl ester carboxylesterase
MCDPQLGRACIVLSKDIQMMLPIEGHHLRTVDLGRGTPILMHDGWVASWDLWLPLIEALQSRWRCIAYDHRCTGASTFPPEATSFQSLVDDVFRVLDAHGVDQAVLAGESLGGMVCMQAALQQPSRVSGLVLVGSFPRTAPTNGGARPTRVESDWQTRISNFVSACMPEPDAAALHRLARGTLLPAGPEAAEATSAAFAGQAPALESIRVPTLVIHGALDAISPIAGAHELAARIPDAELYIHDDAGHVPILTRPASVAKVLDAWWQRVIQDRVQA